MSILIKGMEMPTEGYRLILIHADGTVQTTDGETTAVPVPEHGRLIDADALMLKIKDYIEEYDDLDENGYHNLKWCAMKEVEMAIEDAPTIISSAEMI